MPHINERETFSFDEVPDGPRLVPLMSSGSKMEPRYACLIEAKASYLHGLWVEVSFSAPNLLHNGLMCSYSKCLKMISNVTVLCCDTVVGVLYL